MYIFLFFLFVDLNTVRWASTIEKYILIWNENVSFTHLFYNFSFNMNEIYVEY